MEGVPVGGQAERIQIVSSPRVEHDDAAGPWYATRAAEFRAIRNSSIRFGETHEVKEKDFWKKALAEGRTRTFPGFATRLPEESKARWDEEHDAVLRLVDYVDRRRQDCEHSSLVSFAGLTAAHILGLPTVSEHPEKAQRQVPPQQLHSTTTFSRTRSVTVAPETVELAGLQVSSIAQTVVDLARWEGMEDGLIAADFMLHNGLGTREQVAAIVEKLGPVAGIGNARLVLELMDPRIESPGESLTRWRFYEAGISGFEPQVMALLIGRRYRMDFFDNSTGTNVEFDGFEKISNPLMRNGKSFDEAMADEARRQRALRQVGIQSYRIEWKNVTTAQAFERWLNDMRPYGLPY